MQPLSAFPETDRRTVRGVFVDIDETLTTDGNLTAAAYAALERLHVAGKLCVPITGRPAGWCDHIARMWPVDAVVGENGAFYFRYDQAQNKLVKRFLLAPEARAANRARLDEIGRRILAEVPGVAIASDQPYRDSDLAIDFREDVEPVPAEAVDRVVAIFEAEGATAKVSSIHVNGWIGTYDKLAMTRIMLDECFGIELDAEKQHFVFVGDSPNDAPMFAYFPHAVGVANVRDFAPRMAALPAYISAGKSGAGFAEIADFLLGAP
ncbi:MAG: HAD-IIB family hydrolase [Alphaproteobacteria bacterium]